MAPRKSPAKKTAQPKPLLEWGAAALGLAATLAVLGYSAWEAMTDHAEPPQLSVTSGAAKPGGVGWVVPIVVRNTSHATAAEVEVRASLEAGGRVVEERRVTFNYVPGQGEVSGGVALRTDPATGQLRLEAEGWQDP